MKLTPRSLDTPAASDATAPAFYALRRGAWRDYITLLHPPYTLWHLSYVALGAALAPTLHYDRLAATLVAFFLALGISAHAMDELAGRPLRTRIPDRTLVALAAGGLVGAVALGVVGVLNATPWLAAFIVFGLFIAPAYNLEWFRGRFHSDFWFAAAWGVFPFLTSYWVNAERFALPALLGAIAVFALSLAQRTLSKRVRAVRRRVRSLEGRIIHHDGQSQGIDRNWALAPDEAALGLMAISVTAMAAAMLIFRA